MPSQKMENQLRMALELPESVRQEILDLDTGFSETEDTWTVIVRYVGNIDRLEAAGNGREPKKRPDRGRVAHVEAPLTPGIVGIRYPLLDCLSPQLCKYDADIQHGSAHGGGGIELFGRGNTLHVVLLKEFHHGCEVQDRTADTVQLVDHHTADQAPREFPLAAFVAVTLTAPGGENDSDLVRDFQGNIFGQVGIVAVPAYKNARTAQGYTDVAGRQDFTIFAVVDRVFHWRCQTFFDKYLSTFNRMAASSYMPPTNTKTAALNNQNHRWK